MDHLEHVRPHVPLRPEGAELRQLRDAHARDLAARPGLRQDGGICSSSSNLPAYGIEGGRASLLWAIPFIAAAVFFYRRSTPRPGPQARLLMACGIAALGIAPHFDAYRQPLPIWLRWWHGDEVSIGYALLSFVVTWAVIYGQMRLLHRHRTAPAGSSRLHAVIALVHTPAADLFTEGVHAAARAGSR